MTKSKERFLVLLGRYLRLEDTKDEIWKSIPNFEYYEVSNFGKVRSLTRKVHCKPSKNRKEKWITIRGRLLACTPCIVGYPRVKLTNHLKETKEFHVHRLVATAFLDNCLGFPNVNHIDNNKLNNHVDNLEWCTQSSNCLHAFDINASKHGEDHWKSKLTEDQVREIRYRLQNEKITQTSLAEQYNVTQTTIRRIAIGKTWRRLSN